MPRLSSRATRPRIQSISRFSSAATTRRTRCWTRAGALSACSARRRRYPQEVISADTLLTAYASGWFPMSVAPGDIRWYSPDPRGIIPLDTFHAPRRLARTVRQQRFELRYATAFRAVISACANREDADGNWIDEEILESYCGLHELG